MILTRCGLFFALFLTFYGCTGEQKKSQSRPIPESIAPGSHHELKEFFSTLDYDWDSVPEGVPSFILDTFPADLPRITQPTEKKEIFFLSLLPMVLLANEKIASQRTLFESIMADYQVGKVPSDETRIWLQTLAFGYRLEGDPLENPKLAQLLLQRLDIIPPSLVLAQAATESGYGTSRLVQEQNNLFGEYTFASPAEESQGQKQYRAQHFPTLYDSVQSYMKNLNTHRAYASFRTLRAEFRKQGRPLIGSELAKGLTAYSVRGQAYVRDIQRIIRQNRLSLLASVNLRNENQPAKTPDGESNNLPVLATELTH